MTNKTNSHKILRSQHPTTTSLTNSFIWTFTGNVAGMLSQLTTLYVIVRFGTMDSVGRYSLGLAIATPVFTFANMSLRSVYVSDNRQQYSFSYYLLVRTVTSILAAASIATFILVTQGPLDGVVSLVAAGKAVEALADILYSWWHRQARMDLIAISQITKSLLATALFTFTYLVSAQIELALLMQIVGLVAGIAMFDTPRLRSTFWTMPPVSISRHIRSNNQAPFNISQIVYTMRALVITSLPMGLAASLVAFTFNVPRYGLEMFASTASVGLFTVLSYPAVVSNTAMNAMALAGLPRLVRLVATGDAKQFHRVFLRMQLFAVLSGILLVVLTLAAGKPLLQLLFGLEYAQHFGSFVILASATAVGFCNWFLDTALTAIRAFTRMFQLQLAVMIALIILTAALVPGWGLAGAALATLISGFAQVLLKAGVYYLKTRDADVWPSSTKGSLS